MTNTNTNIVPVMSEDTDWVTIVNELTDKLTGEDVPDKVVRAIELMLAGTPNYKIAKDLGVSQQTIRGWFTKYPVIAHVLANGRQLLSKWRMSQLEQQFIKAIERSEEILSTDLGTEVVDPKILTVVAAQSRYIIGLFAGQKVDVTVTHELGDTVMKAKKDALDYISEKLGENDEPIDITYRVIDPKVDNQKPLLTEDGNPIFGVFGIIKTDEEGSLCHICGEKRKDFSKHVQVKHAMSNEEYELTYLLDSGSVAKADA